MAAGCAGGCEIKLLDSNVTLGNGGSAAGTARLGGKAALTIRRSSVRGLHLGPASGAANVIVTIVLSELQSSSIDPSILNASAIFNSKFSDPPLHETLQGSSFSCEELQKRQICDRYGSCSDALTGGRQCGCPSGFEAGTGEDGSRCLDVCALAQNQPIYADANGTELSFDSATVTDSTRLDFSSIHTHLKNSGVDASKVTVWIVPTTAMHSGPLGDTSGLIETGKTSTGAYEVQLRIERVVCKIVAKLQLRCTPGYSAADGEGMACMPVVGITAAGIRIFSSTGDVLFNGTLLAPISAGDRLRVEVDVLDILGAPVTRSSLGLEVVLEQMPAGKWKNNTSPFTPPTNGSNSFKVTVNEMWIKEAAQFQSAVRHPLLGECERCA